MTVGTWLKPNYLTQTGTAYPLAIDADMAVAERIVTPFAPFPASPADMTVNLFAGSLFVAGALIEVAAQAVTIGAAPMTDSRIDRIVIDAGTGVAGVVAGTADPAPVAPAIPSGFLPIAQVLVAAGTVAIASTMITDERQTFPNLYSPALLGNPTTTTQQAKNNSTRLANTAFVQTEKAFIRAVTTLTTSTTLSGSYLGGLIVCDSATDIMLTLQTPSTYSLGRQSFANINAGAVTLAGAAAGQILLGGAVVDSVVLPPGANIDLVSNGTYWIVTTTRSAAISEADFIAGTGTVDGEISPAKLAAAITARAPSLFGPSGAWRAVSRSIGIAYQNTTPYYMFIEAQLNTSNASGAVRITPTIALNFDLLTFSVGGGSTSVAMGATFIVPPGHYYMTTGSVSIWREFSNA